MLRQDAARAGGQRAGRAAGQHDAGVQRHRGALRGRGDDGSSGRGHARRWPATGCRSPSTTSARMRLDRDPGEPRPWTRTSRGSTAWSTAGLTPAAEVSVKLSAVGQALDRTGTDVALDNARRICAGGARGGHHGDLGHGGPHHHRLHARRPRRAAAGLPGDRRGRPGLAAPHRGRLQGSRARRARGFGCARGRTRSRSGRLPVAPRRRPVVRALSQGADARRRLPDGRHPRPAADPHRRDAGRPGRPGPWDVRVPDAVRHPTRRAEAAGRRGRVECGSTSRTATSGTAT